VAGLAALRLEPVGVCRDVAAQVKRMGRDPELTRKRFDHAIAQAPRVVESAECQTGAAQRMVGPAATADHSRRRLKVEKLLAFPDAVLRLARLTELRQQPSGRGDRGGKQVDDVPGPKHFEPAL